MHHRYPDSHCDLPGPSTVIWVRPYGAIPTFSIYSDVVSFGHVPVHLAACIKEERQKIPYRNTTQYKSDACIWATVSSLKKKRIEFHVEREKDLINEACMNESLRAGPTHTVSVGLLGVWWTKLTGRQPQTCQVHGPPANFEAEPHENDFRMQRVFQRV